MLQLIKVSAFLFAVKDTVRMQNATIAVGSFAEACDYLREAWALPFEEVDEALRIMDASGNNCANFGIMGGTFMYSSNVDAGALLSNIPMERAAV